MRFSLEFQRALAGVGVPSLKGFGIAADFRCCYKTFPAVRLPRTTACGASPLFLCDQLPRPQKFLSHALRCPGSMKNTKRNFKAIAKCINYEKDAMVGFQLNDFQKASKEPGIWGHPQALTVGPVSRISQTLTCRHRNAEKIHDTNWESH